MIAVAEPNFDNYLDDKAGNGAALLKLHNRLSLCRRIVGARYVSDCHMQPQNYDIPRQALAISYFRKHHC